MWAAWLWLLLATIGAHATLPVGSPMVRVTGSAFSATTIDVALAPKRKSVADDPSVERRQPEAGSRRAGAPDPDLPFIAASAAFLQAPVQAAAALPRPPAEPQADSVSARAHRARAPPTF